MLNLKKSISVAMIFAVTCFSAPQNANALVGLVIANAPLAIAGAAATAGAAGFEAYAFYSGQSEGYDDGQLSAAFAALMTVPLGLFGLVLLDGAIGQTIQYKAVNAQEAQKLGLTSEEVASYNSHLEEVNLVLQSVESDLGEIKNPTTKDSAAVWSKYSGALPQATMSATAKISAAAFKK